MSGSDNQQLSNVLEHVASEQHKKAMAQFHTVQVGASSTPIT